jgi:probable HAF family extracellular repeat protein
VALTLAISVSYGGGGGGNGGSFSPPTIASVSVSCNPTTVQTGQTSECTATVTGTGEYIPSVTWTATGGTITSSGMFTPTSPGTVTITATSTQDIAKWGTAQVGVATPTALAITISDLPTGALANVTVTDPNGQQTTVTSSQIINAIPGTYTLTAGPVVVGISTYIAAAITQTATVTSDNTTTATVDYGNIVPMTTKVLDSATWTGPSVSSDGLTLTMSASGPMAQSLTPGDVIVVPPTSADGVAPKGMLRKVVSVSSNDSEIVATTQMGTLADAFERVSLQIQAQLAANTIRAVHPAPGVTFRKGASFRRVVNGRKLQATSASFSDPCGGNSLGIFDITQPIQIDAVPGLTLSGSLEVCSGLNFTVNFGRPGILWFHPQGNSLRATASIGAYSDLILQGDFLSGSFDQQITLATLEFGAIPIPGLPVWVTPEVSVFVGAKGNLTSGVSTEVSASGTFTGGVSYASGTWARVPLTPSFQFAYQPPALDASMSAKAYAGIEFDVYVYDVIGPSFKPDAYLDLEANISQNPWWTITGGLEGPMSFNVSFLGEDLFSYYLGTMFDYTDAIDSAPGPFLPGLAVPAIQSITPQQVTVGSSSFKLSVIGSNFIPGAVVNFGSTSLLAAWQSSSQLTASVPSGLVSASGTFQVSVTNPGATGTTSNALTFTVTAAPSLTVTVSPLTAQVPVNGLQQFTAAVTGASNTAVDWSVNGVGGGNSEVGTISAGGLFTAPGTVPNPATVTVTATSQSNPSASASASVTITTLSYNFIALVYSGSSTFGGTWAYGINTGGQVVGLYGPDLSAESWDWGSGGFSYASGAYSVIEYPGTVDFQPCGSFAAEGARATAAFDINDKGQIVGAYSDCSNNDVANGFLYSGDVFSPINYPGAAEGTYVSRISNSGEIVGSYTDSNGVSHGFLYAGGAFSSIDYPGATSTAASCINDSGQIVGSYTDSSGATHGFLYAGASFSSVDYHGATSTAPSRINNSGQIVGSYTDSSGTSHGFLYAGGTFSSIDYPGAASTTASRINNSGQIVGSYTDSSGATHGFLYAGGTFSSIDYPGATGGFTSPSGINDSGQIIGTYAPLANDLDTNGFLATPQP